MFFLLCLLFIIINIIIVTLIISLSNEFGFVCLKDAWL